MVTSKMTGHRIGEYLLILTCFVVVCLSADGRFNRVRLSHAEKEERTLIGRVVQIPAKDYTVAFKVKPPKLGDCALKMDGKRIKTCSEKFGGKEVWIPSASTGVDVSRVETASDVLTHGMGGVGGSVGVLGLASIGGKWNVAVTVTNSNKHLTLMSSYEIKRGVKTLQNPYPLTSIPEDGSLFLSEVEYGGNEILLVTMEFDSVQTRIDVQYQLQIKILFITITAKLQYVKEFFSSASNTKIQFKSSWRKNEEFSYTNLEDAINKTEEIEAMYLEGPQKLKEMTLENEDLQSTYYFSAWKNSPYGSSVNVATITNELNTLNEQYVEIESVVERIEQSLESKWIEFLHPEKKKIVEDFKEEMKTLKAKMIKAQESYHTLSPDERSKLLDIYGQDKAPGYYERKLKQVLGY